MDYTFSIAIDRMNKQDKEAIQSDGQRRNFEHCVSRVVTHYPIGMWLMGWHALNVWEDHGHQHLRDVALAVQCTGNAY
ncbi:hypothetical protein TNCV_194461 [Trichonephila clavipes]|nr:hypothetical protein TNCV_194461 [Trichonephila clavipes]